MIAIGPEDTNIEPSAMMSLALPADFPLPGLVTDLADADTMFDGRSDHYLRVGLSALRLIERVFDGRPEPRRILDLPCGFGRVTRVLRARYPQARITVCDLDRPGVDFAAQHFGARAVYSRADFHDLELRESYDLIWVGSLLTHLPEHQTRQFLDFAARHLAPEGRLVATSHGSYVAGSLLTRDYGLSQPAIRGLLADYRMNGYGYRGYDGDPAYGVSLTARGWFEQAAIGSPLVLEAYRERGWDRHQDVVVMRRRRPAAGWSRALEKLIGGRVFGPESRWFERAGHCVPPRPGPEQARQDAAGVNGFDEIWYLGAYPDVAAAVAAGAVPSGQAHYLDFGWRELRPFCDPRLTFDGRAPAGDPAYADPDSRRSRVSEAWSADPEDEAEDHGWYWLAHPVVKARVNRLTSGDPALDGYDRLAQLLRERGWTLPIPRSVSLGCGFGGLERDLAARGMIAAMDAYDLSEDAIAEARRKAAALQLADIRYHVADLEKTAPPARSADVVFAHSSVHHVERLEPLFAAVRLALRPGGIFHLNEFVGPTRFQWTDTQLDLANGWLDSLPGRLRCLPSGHPKEKLQRPTVAAMIAADPSEAIRSADIREVLQQDFEVIEERQLGGALLHLALGGIAQNFDPANGEDMAFLQQLFTLEDEAMADGRIGSDFMIITAVPRAAA
jgi:SAM-dependent methyltransferase